MWSALVALVICALALPAPAHAAGATVHIWMTTADQSKLLQQQPSVAFGSSTPANPFTITVNEGTAYQQMQGFGAAFTDSAAWLVAAKLTVAQRNALLVNLFDPKIGIGLNFLRQPIGASDFALYSYTYDDMPAGQTDPTLSHFSIGHDLPYILPLLKIARSLNPNVKIIASPWTAPAWMKTGGSLFTGSLAPADYGAYAAYLVKFIQAYTAQGVPIYAITPGNEPTFVPSGPIQSPAMTMTAPQEAVLIGGSLGPAFASAGITGTKILTLDESWQTWPFANTVLSDQTARRYIAGTAFHCYSGYPGEQTYIHNMFPNKDIYFTECSHGFVTPTPFAQALAYDMHNVLIGATRNWASTVLKWNIALDQNGGPSPWCSLARDCYGLVTVNTSTGALSYNEDYYALGHLSKFVAPGAYRIDSTSYGSGSVEDVAFKNPDGSKVLLVFNGAATASAFTVRWGSQSFADTLPAGAAATFTWTGAPS